MAEFITRGSLPSKTTRGAFHGQHLFRDLFLSYILFLLCVRVLRHAYGGQRTTGWSQLSPSHWVGPRDWTQFVRLSSKWLYPESHLSGSHAETVIQSGNGSLSYTKICWVTHEKAISKNQIAQHSEWPASCFKPSLLSLASEFQRKPLGPGNSF